MLKMEEEIDFTIPTIHSDKKMEINITDIVKLSGSGGSVNLPDPEYEQFLADVWVGIVLTLMVLSCVCFMCSCLIYHKFQQWKSRVIEARNTANLEAGSVESELPSYTIASGLPTYEEALEQLKKVKELSGFGNVETIENWTPRTPPTPQVNSLSVVSLFQIYKNGSASSVKTST